jgi:hypothetical protein
MLISDYYIISYWWLIHYRLLLVILGLLSWAIDGYYIINYCWLF